MDWGEWYYYTIEADYHRTVEDSVYLDPEGTIVEVTLCCLDPVTDLEATGETVERPTLDPLTIELEWTAADSTCCDPDTYYIYRSESPFLNVSDPDVELLDKVAHPTVTYDDETVEDGVKYYYDVVVKYVCGNSELAGNVNATSETEPDEDEILIIDWDNDAEPLNSETKGVGEWWYDMLTGTGLGVSSMGVVMTDYNDDGDDPLEGYDLSDYTLVIVALGIQDDDDELLPTETQDKLDAYRATAGGKMIIEGPDFGYDYEGEDFFDNFDLAFGYDGGSETEDSIYSIWGEDDIWDHISLNFKYDAGKLADRNNDTLYATTSLTKKRGWDEDGVTRIFYYNGPSKAIVSTIYLGGIVDSAGLTQVRAVSGYLWTLGISNTGIVDAGGKLPDEFALSGCYPNPFNPVTSIVIDVATNAPVELEIFDITGKHIATLVDQNLARGRYIVTWDGSDVPSGTYFARMLSGKFRATQKLMLIK